MTSGDERSESPGKPSGERSDPRGSEDRPEGDPRETRTGSEATRERSEGDRSEPSEESSEGDRSESPGKPRGAEQSDTNDDVPLNIAGHDAEKERRQRESEDGMAALTESTESDADGEDGEDDAGNEASDQDDVLSEFDISEPRSDDEEVEPVELLVQLAEDGEIDPWDIDVVTVTDKFLARLDGSDLRTGGRALFYASVLLRMKSDAMWVDEDEQEDEEWADEPWEMPEGERPEGAPAVDPFQKLEREMDRRIERKTARGMPETLDELVRDLRERERDTWWKESRTYDTSESPSGYSRGTQTLDYHGHDDFRMDDEPTAADVTGTAHDEHMEDIINDVYVELQSHYDQGREEVLFAEIREAGGSVVNSFLGVLFLAHRGQVRLQQDDLFGDLWIQDPAAMPADEAAAADV